MSYSNMTQKDYGQYFHKLHCILRNGELGLTGMPALNEINNIVLLLFIEPSLGKFEIDNKYSFSYLYNNYVIPLIEHKPSMGKNIVKIGDLIDYYVMILGDIYSENELIKKYILSDTNRMTSLFVLDKTQKDDEEKQIGFGKQLSEMIEETVNFFFHNGKKFNTPPKITSKMIEERIHAIDFDILGDAYEKFKEDDVGNSGKTTGQFFTPRCVIKYIVEDLIKPKYTEICYDSSCGTGGFIHYLAKHVKQHVKNEKHIKQFNNNIHGNDKNPELIKPLYINLFLHQIDIKNIKNRNSLGRVNCSEYLEKFDVIVGNPPYGVKNKIVPHDFIFKDDNNKEINYWSSCLNTSGKSLILDSMAQFMVHTINSLKVNGRFSLVIDRGILNNGTDSSTSWNSKLREFLFLTCDIHKIILLPKGIFTHTMFDTAIIYGTKKISFNKYSKINFKSSFKIDEYITKSIKMYVSTFEDEVNKKGIIVPDECLELTLEQIMNKKWSLKYDDYIDKVDNSINGIEYKTLGDVCEFQKGNAFKSNEFIKSGIKLLKVSNIQKSILVEPFDYIKNNTIYDKFNVKLNDIIIVLVGSTFGKLYFNLLDEKMYLNQNSCIIRATENNQKYLYIYLILHNFTASKDNAQPFISLTDLGNIKIPILPQDHQQRIVEFMDNNIDNNAILDKLVSLFKNIDLFKFLIYEDYDAMQLAIEYAKEMLKYETKGKELYNIKRRCAFKMIKKGEMKTLGNILKDVKTGKSISKNKLTIQNETNIYPYYGANGIIGYTNSYLFDGNYILTSRNGTLGTIYISNNKFYPSDHTYVLFNKDNINVYYLAAYLKYCVNFKKLNSHNGMPGINHSILKRIPINIPSLEDQENIVKMIENIDNEENKFNETMDYIKYMVETIYNNVEHTINYNQSNNNDENNNDEDESEKESEEEPEFEMVKYNDTEYILEDNIIYKIKEDENGDVSMGSKFGTWNDGKVKKYIVKKVIATDNTIDA